MQHLFPFLFIDVLIKMFNCWFYFKVSSIYRLYSKCPNCQFSYNFTIVRSWSAPVTNDHRGQYDQFGSPIAKPLKSGTFIRYRLFFLLLSWKLFSENRTDPELIMGTVVNDRSSGIQDRLTPRWIICTIDKVLNKRLISRMIRIHWFLKNILNIVFVRTSY